MARAGNSPAQSRLSSLNLVGRLIPGDNRDFRRRTLPVIVWALSAVVVAGMLLQRTQRYHYVGIAQSIDYEISSSVRGTLESVNVRLGDRVAAGDVVARMVDTSVSASIETAKATLRRLTSELNAEKVRLAAERGQQAASWTADLRRFQIDEEQRRLDSMAMRVAIESDEIEAEKVAFEERSLRPMMDNGVVSEDEVESLRLQREQVDSRILKNKALLAQMERELTTARMRREEFQARYAPRGSDDPLLTPLQDAIAEENQLLKEIQLSREALVLRSPVAGQISQLLCRKGQAVVEGEPIAIVVEPSVQEVVAWLSEDDRRPIRERAPVLISSRSPSGAAAESVVLRVGATIQPLPQRLWRDPRNADYGRAVVIAASASMLLEPGEIVDVKFLASN